MLRKLGFKVVHELNWNTKLRTIFIHPYLFDYVKKRQNYHPRYFFNNLTICEKKVSRSMIF